MADVETLRKFSLLQNLEPQHLEVLARNLRPLHMEAGDVMIAENSETRGPLFLVLSGEMNISRQDASGESHLIATLSSPTVVGELEFLADVRGSATVQAKTQVEGWLLPRDRFASLFSEGEAAAYHIALAIGRVLSQRLAVTNQLLVKALADSPSRLRTISNAQFDSDALARIDQELESLLDT